MLLSRLASTSQALAATRSRLAKRELIAAVLADATVEDVQVVVSYLAGGLRQRRTGVGWRSLESLPAPAEEASLTVLEVDCAFAEMAGLSGPGSAVARNKRVAALMSRATAQEQDLLRGLIFGELRQGALESQVQEGLAAAYGVGLALVRRAAMLLSSTPAAAELLLTGGGEALAAVGLQVGTAVQPMLAASAPGPEEAVAKTGLPALVDYKLDGIRVQVHRDGEQVRVFTRSLDDITARVPEVVAAVTALPYTRLVLDGEALAVRGDGRPETFQVSAARTASSTDVATMAEHTPLRVFFFDLLHVDGRDLLDADLTSRAETMAEVLPPELQVPRRLCAGLPEVSDAFAQAVRGGFEGVVVKNVSASYAAGRRDAAWVKLKPRHTFDLVVTAAEWGHGRRQGWLSNLHLAARDGATGQLVMLGKTFKGLTDELLAWQTEQFLARETRRTAGTVHVEPSLVVEVACDGLQSSTRYPGGVALRFARVLRYRPDKVAADCDTLETVRLLLPVAGDGGS
ncbi:MAG TPA: ATP-dependent DNA ligase [Propionibacteriaceae bacterium]|nr:ATP-dependent DNA ligase [Propionibacteriaceae bacterium]